MKVKTMKSIYISQEELKEAIIVWLRDHWGERAGGSAGDEDLAIHMESNPCDFEWTHQDDGVYLAVDMDGYFEENEE